MALMYELKEDFILSNSDLAKKYSNDLIDTVNNNTGSILNNKQASRTEQQKASSSKEWHQLLNDINLSKVIEDKLIKDNRTLGTIGKPIEFRVDLNDKFNYFNENIGKVDT